MYGVHQCAPDSAGDCWYDASVGQVEKNGFKFKTPGNGTTWYVDGAASQLIVTPNPNAFMHIVQSPDTGLYHVYFRTAATAALTIGYDAEMPIATFGVPDTDPRVVELTHGNGQAWEVDDNTLYSQVGYSANGQWMALWNQSGYVVIVDLSDFSTRTISVGTPIDFALSTVSDDGHYLALSTTDGNLTLYDLNHCDVAGLVGDVAAESCPARDVGAALGVYLGLADGTPVGFGIPQFVDNDVLKYTTTFDYQQYYIWAPNTLTPVEDGAIHQIIYPPVSELNYLALGDSYASGEGEGNDTFLGGTDVQDVNMCHLSWLSYPYLINKATWLDSVHSVACSGAKIADVTNGAQHPTVPKQNDLGYWLPGHQKQLQYVEDKHPTIVTVSMSGNDIGFSDIMKACILHSDTCYDTREDRQELVGLINRQFDRLVGMYQQIQQAAAPNAHIYVVGYPSIVKADGDCGNNVHLNAKETEFANGLIDYLDVVIKKATQKAGIGYVDTESAFVGHRLCETATDFAVNGITIGHDTAPISQVPLKLLSNGGFHPTQYGHKLLALAIELQTKDFTVPMPHPDSAVAEPRVDDAASFLGGVPSTGRPVQTLQYRSDMSNDVLYKNLASIASQPSANLLSADGLLAGSQVHAWLHSDPIDLGTFTANTAGQVSLDAALPSSVPTGFHTLYLDVTDANGQAERLFKTVYVAASPDDLDGDGVPNALEPCLIFEVPDGQLTGDGYDCSGVAVASTSATPGVPIKAVTSLAATAGEITPTNPSALNRTQSIVLTSNSPPKQKSKEHEARASHHLWTWIEMGLIVLVLLIAIYAIAI